MERLQRRLAAVFALDTVSYSRLMEADGEGTHRRLGGLMNGIIEPALAAASGQVIKRTGDGLLAEFPSVADAIRAAVRVQTEAVATQEGVAPDQKLRFRVGINLGDVIHDAGDIFGDGVNIAARLEGLGQPGDIIVSETAMHAVDRAGYSFVDLGVQRLKNISRPVRAFRVTVSEGTTGRVDTGLDKTVPGFGARPAIAVLPFRYSGPDATEQEHFVDGVTEDLIAALSRWRFFPVISRGSVFTYKGRNVDPVDVAQQLGARYVLEGSLRRQGPRVRTGIDLVDADSRQTLLAEQYQYELEDIFAIQDEIVRHAIGALEPELLRHERERALRAPPQNATAYEMFLRGQWHHYRYNRQDNVEAQACFKKALELAPAYAHASAGLALACVHAANVRWGDREVLYNEAMLRGRNSVRVDPRDPMAHLALGLALQNGGYAPAEAAASLQEAVRLDPSNAAAHANLGFVYNFMNRPDQALAEIELALRLSPHDPRRFIWLPAQTIAHYLSGRYRDALMSAQETLRLKPEFPVPLRHLLATLGRLGRAQEAAQVLPLVQKLDGGLAGTEAYLGRMFEPEALERILEGLRKAGLT